VSNCLSDFATTQIISECINEIKETSAHNAYPLGQKVFKSDCGSEKGPLWVNGKRISN
jgi:hypothetical protein